MQIRLNRFLDRTTVEGPGLRACLWVQGCSIRCPGCFNEHMWDASGGYIASVESLSQRILEDKEIEGVTYLGGEPFEQAEALAELGRILRDHGRSIVTFTGLTLESIKKKNNNWNALLEVTDLLIDGPYIKSKLDLSRPWVGSTNQRYHFLTDRYNDLAAKLKDTDNKVELRIGPDGSISVNGMISKTQLWQILQHLNFKQQ